MSGDVFSNNLRAALWTAVFIALMWGPALSLPAVFDVLNEERHECALVHDGDNPPIGWKLLTITKDQCEDLKTTDVQIIYFEFIHDDSDTRYFEEFVSKIDCNRTDDMEGDMRLFVSNAAPYICLKMGYHYSGRILDSPMEKLMTDMTILVLFGLLTVAVAALVRRKGRKN